MLQNEIYSVISPEGCATILWKDPTKILEAAEAMKLTANDLLNLEIIDEIINEPVGGAHRDKELILENLRNSLNKNLAYFSSNKSDCYYSSLIDLTNNNTIFKTKCLPEEAKNNDFNEFI